MTRIRDNIDDIIEGIIFLLDNKAFEDFGDSPVRLEGGEGMPSYDFLGLFHELHRLRSDFELVASFLGISLSPLETELLNLVERIYFIEKPHKYKDLFKADTPLINIMPKSQGHWNQVGDIFQEWLLLLKSWRTVIRGAGEKKDFLDRKFKLYPSK